MSEDTIDLPLTDGEIARLQNGETLEVQTDDSVDQDTVEIHRLEEDE